MAGVVVRMVTGAHGGPRAARSLVGTHDAACQATTLELLATSPQSAAFCGTRKMLSWRVLGATRCRASPRAEACTRTAQTGDEFRLLLTNKTEAAAVIPRLRVLARSQPEVRPCAFARPAPARVALQRACPQDKRALVRWLKDHGHVVAVTGAAPLAAAVQPRRALTRPCAKATERTTRPRSRRPTWD